MGKRAKEPEKAPNHERWLITYSDLITLLMIFFIIMYTISNVNAKKFAQLSSSLSSALVGQNSGYFIGEAPGPLVIPEQSAGAQKKEMEEMKKAKEQLDAYIKGQNLGGKVVVAYEERGLVISLKETMFFAIGSAAINPQAQETLIKIGQVLKNMPNNLRIEGHTCNLPIRTANFPSNWELSTARATNVVKFLIDRVGFDPKRLSATGYGEYRPLVPNTSEANRAMNRRVDIVVLRTVLNLAEPNSGENVQSNGGKPPKKADLNTVKTGAGVQNLNPGPEAGDKPAAEPGNVRNDSE
ncbi:OmpA/MotB family protein [Thermincola ferriacetica]